MVGGLDLPAAEIHAISVGDAVRLVVNASGCIFPVNQRRADAIKATDDTLKAFKAVWPV